MSWTRNLLALLPYLIGCSDKFIEKYELLENGMQYTLTLLQALAVGSV